MHTGPFEPPTAKLESPELDSAPNDIPVATSSSTALEHVRVDSSVGEVGIEGLMPVSESLIKGSTEMLEPDVTSGGQDVFQERKTKQGAASQLLAKQRLLTNSSFRSGLHGMDVIKSSSRNIFDLVDIDSENSQQLPRPSTLEEPNKIQKSNAEPNDFLRPTLPNPWTSDPIALKPHASHERTVLFPKAIENKESPNSKMNHQGFEDRLRSDKYIHSEDQGLKVSQQYQTKLTIAPSEAKESVQPNLIGKAASVYFHGVQSLDRLQPLPQTSMSEDQQQVAVVKGILESSSTVNGESQLLSLGVQVDESLLDVTDQPNLVVDLEGVKKTDNDSLISKDVLTTRGNKSEAVDSHMVDEQAKEEKLAEKETKQTRLPKDQQARKDDLAEEMAGFRELMAKKRADDARLARMKAKNNNSVTEKDTRATKPKEAKAKETKHVQEATLAEKKINSTKVHETRAEAVKQTEEKVREARLAKSNSDIVKLTGKRQSASLADGPQGQARADIGNSKQKKLTGDKKLSGTNISMSSCQREPFEIERSQARSKTISTLDLEDSNEGSPTSEKPRLRSRVVSPRGSSSIEQNPATSRKSWDVQGHGNVTPLDTRNDSNRKRKSMTPAFPASSASMLSQGSIVISNGKPSRNPMITDKLPRSALRQTPSTARRSVSFASDSVTVPDFQVSVAAVAVPDVTHSKPSTDFGVSSFKGDSLAKTLSNFKTIKSNPRKPKESPVIDAINDKGQAKRNITRDVKLKGRLNKAPLPPQQTISEEIVISSDSEESASSYYSDDDVEARTSKAGPSKRRRLKSQAHSSKETQIKIEPISRSSTPPKNITRPIMKQSPPTINKNAKLISKQSSTIAPQVKQLDQELSTALVTVISKAEKNQPSASQLKAGKPDSKRSPTLDGNIDPQILAFEPSETSSPRAPALYMSRAVSLSSGSTNSSMSGSESEDGNGSSPMQTETILVKKGEASHGRVSGGTKDNIQILQENSTVQNGSGFSSRSSKASSISSRSSEITERSASKQTECEADEQLQRESRQSTEPYRLEDSKSVLLNPVVAGKLRNPASKARPANSRYPSMTELMNKRSAEVMSRPLSHRPDYITPSKFGRAKEEALSPFSVSGSSSSALSSSDDGDS